jgi:hypothetical protein
LAVLRFGPSPGSVTTSGLAVSSAGAAWAIPLIDAAIYLQTIPAAINDVDQPLGVKLD